MMPFSLSIILMPVPQAYSNGHSEIVLGKAIKDLQLPREEIVVMTKVLHARPYTLSRA